MPKPELDLSMIHSAAIDAANRQMRTEGRTAWNLDDWNLAARTYGQLTPEGHGVQPTRVIFRRWPDSDGGDVIALFPDEAFDMAGRYCTSYQHVGQHGAADFAGVMGVTRAATAAEAADLRAELEGMGYVLDEEAQAEPPEARA